MGLKSGVRKSGAEPGDDLRTVSGKGDSKVVYLVRRLDTSLFSHGTDKSVLKS